MLSSTRDYDKNSPTVKSQPIAEHFHKMIQLRLVKNYGTQEDSLEGYTNFAYLRLTASLISSFHIISLKKICSKEGRGGDGIKMITIKLTETTGILVCSPTMFNTSLCTVY